MGKINLDDIDVSKVSLSFRTHKIKVPMYICTYIHIWPSLSTLKELWERNELCGDHVITRQMTKDMNLNLNQVGDTRYIQYRQLQFGF